MEETEEKEDRKKVSETTVDRDLGKLKRTLGKRCPYCSKNLQLRSRKRLCIERGEEFTKDEDYIVCPNCGEYEEEVKEKRNRRRQKCEDDVVGY